ncbi:MAG: invasion associated locus B family protein [Hyphomicrobiaceae bacterium]|nr:invasion associated locus B family protein [Hyphomicrobiaceae bacterium]
MVTSLSADSRILPAAGKAGLLTATFAGALFLSAAANAQQQPQPAAKTPPAATAQAGGAQQGSWVKLCQAQKTKDSKQVNVCLTHHERFHPTTGQPLVSAAIRQIEGQKEPIMMFMVPLGRLLAPGLIMQVDEKEPLKLGYTYCTALGCVAQAPVSDEIISSFKKGGTLTIKTIDVGQKKVGFQVPLSGFTRALDGPPIDRKVYAQARKEMFDLIRARQKELAKKQQTQQNNPQPQQAPAQAPKKLQ